MTNILARAAALNLRVVSYTNHLTAGPGQKYWIPRDCVANDGKAGIFWRMNENGRRDVPGATYDFDGWEPWADGSMGVMFGGRYQTFESALSWIERALDIRAGRATDFLGR